MGNRNGFITLVRPFLKTRRRPSMFLSGSQRRHPPNAAHFTETLGSPDAHDILHRYTSGRWLYDEQLQLERRFVKFNARALQETASRILRSQCVEISKLPEGLYNKVFCLKMENGKEILARIPNPNAGHPHYVVASEVATLDFLRNVLNIPVPTVIGWSSSSLQYDPVGTEYMLMERVAGRQLSEVWPGMSEAQRFGLVKSLVQIEAKLASVKFSSHGSLYYRDDYPDGWHLMNAPMPHGSGTDVISKFVIGPTTERSFWADENRELDIDRGPWAETVQYFSAVTNREIARIRHFAAGKPEDAALLSGRTRAASEKHIRLLDQFLRVLPHILPPQEISLPTLLHHDLHSDNIFVDDTDPTKISGIIDWQAVYTAPLFLQARFPSVFDCEGPYPWGAVQPQLPEGFNSLSPLEKAEAMDRYARIRLKKFYELASRKFNPSIMKAMDAMRNDDDPTTFIFHIIGQTSTDGPVPLMELLMQIYEKWDRISERRGLKASCPISFTEEEMKADRQQVQVWADAYNEFDSLRTQVAGKDGWVSHEEFEEAMRRFNDHKENLEILRKRVDDAACLY